MLTSATRSATAPPRDNDNATATTSATIAVPMSQVTQDSKLRFFPKCFVGQRSACDSLNMMSSRPIEAANREIGELCKVTAIDEWPAPGNAPPGMGSDQ